MNKQRMFLIVLSCVVGIILAWGSQFGLAQEGKPENPLSQAQVSQAPFTYQGQLKKNNQPFDDTCRMAFRLYDTSSGGNQVNNPITLTVPVTAGLFTVNLDFGSTSFDGSPRYLETRVQCSSEISYTNMGRHVLTAAPYAANADFLDGQHASYFASSAALTALDGRVKILEGQLTDNDKDLFYAGVQDCDDTNNAIHLGATEICSDTLDNNCDKLIDCADSSCSPDADLDGHNPPPCGGDCADSNPDIYPGHTDYPDTQGLDENCDGIDGEAANAVFVSTTGDDSNDGSRLHPKRTIQAGVMAATAQGKRDVYVASGAYTGQVSLATGIGVYGGYSLDFAERDPFANEVSILPPHPLGSNPGTVNCLHIRGGATGSSVLDGFSIFGDTQPAAGISSYALYIHDCDATVKIAHNRILGGRGGNGTVGANGVNGQSGSNGSAGSNAFDLPDHTCTSGNTSPGGSGGVLICGGVNTSGGNGANRVCPTYSGGQTGYPAQDGFNGYNSGGAGGISGRDYYQNSSCMAVIFSTPTATSGVSGSNGSSGPAGVGCSIPAGTVVSGLWLPNSAIVGAAGTHGRGGGGGGSGAGAYVDSTCSGYSGDNLGGTGGGGGAGGCGGAGGNPGDSGGGAFGMFVYFEASPTSIPTLEDNRIFGGTAGNGGAGGAGGASGNGGVGGTGGTVPSSGVIWPSEGGGRGGDGGHGGYGGGGGGGCGGISYAIYAYGQGTTNLTIWKAQNLLFTGVSGRKGQGGVSPDYPGTDGMDGIAGNTNF